MVSPALIDTEISHADRRNVGTAAYAETNYNVNKTTVKHQCGAVLPVKGSLFYGPKFVIYTRPLTRAVVV